MPRGVALVIGCNTFPTWNAYPGLFASLVTGNAVVVKPHPRAVLPLAITVEVAREVLRGQRLRPGPGAAGAPRPTARAWPRRWPSAPRSRSSTTPAAPASVAGSSARARGRGKPVYTEKAGVNTIVVDSTDDLRRHAGQPRLLAHALLRPDVHDAAEHLRPARRHRRPTRATCPSTSSARSWPRRVGRLTGDDAKAVELLGATVNDDVRASGRPRCADLAARRPGGRWCSTRRRVSTRRTPTRSSARPGLVALDVGRRGRSTRQECFGPVAFLIATDGTAQSLRTFATRCASTAR